MMKVKYRAVYRQKIELLSFFSVVLAFSLSLMLSPLPSYATAFENPDARSASGGGNGIVPVEAAIDAGVIAIGSTAQVVVMFRNEGGTPVNTGAINLYPSSNASATVTMNQCGQEPLPGGADCAIAVSVKGLQAGPWRVAMLMRHDGRSRLVSTVLSGSVEASAEGSDQVISDLEAIPSELDFDMLSASRAQLRSITLRNVTSNPITIESVVMKTDETSGLSIDTECKILKAGEACLVSTKWSPTQKGPTSGVLIVKHDGPTGLTTVNVKGEYTPQSSVQATIFPEAVPGKGLMVSSLSEIDFGPDVITLSAITTSLVNTGDADIKINSIELSGSDNGLEIVSTGCSEETTLEPLDACPLTLSWSPVREGAILDDIKIKHSGARGVLVIPVKGVSTQSVSRDSQSIILDSSPGFSLDPFVESGDSNQTDRSAGVFNEGEESEESEGDTTSSSNSKSYVPAQNNAKVLDGYTITSLAADRAIISSPRGSRVVFDKEPIVIAGVSWLPVVQFSGVEFQSGNEKVLMLFDRSLSSFNTSGAQSGSVSPSEATTPTDTQP